jgi:endonuclease/exonuclease/phosphatase family metal-dependent hydrolase
MLRRRLARAWGIPDPDAPIPVHGPTLGPHERPSPGSSLKVVVWNIQFAAGRERLFFYDGGQAVSVPRSTVLATLGGIGERLRAIDADVVLLQEVDRGSRRTAFLDEHAWLVEALPSHRWHASTPYHRVPYVPAPPHEHLGRVDLHLSVFSKVPLTTGRRHQLPLLRESAVRRWFNLRRAVMDVPLMWGDVPLRLLHTHLSAFSRGDGTVPRQIAALSHRIASAEADGHDWLLAGDFNALPPGTDPRGLHDDDLYGYVSPLGPLYARSTPAVPLTDHARHPTRWATWVPFGGLAPDRAIDHAFARAGRLSFHDVHVDRRALGLSDHLPLVFELRRP